MQIYPAIDLRGGQAVRLLQGSAQAVTPYGDALAQAAAFVQSGATWLHVVDLDGAFEGDGKNGDLIQRVVRQATPCPVQTGGGIRAMADITRRLEDWGVRRVIVGTLAVENPELVRQACEKYPGRIVLGLDARDGMVATRGWVEQTTLPALELALRARDWGIATVIYTDIARDGMLVGPNLKQVAHMVAHSGLDVVASGGIGQLDDVRGVAQTGAEGVIIGKALYEKRFTLEQALLAAQE